MVVNYRIKYTQFYKSNTLTQSINIYINFIFKHTQ